MNLICKPEIIFELLDLSLEIDKIYAGKNWHGTILTNEMAALPVLTNRKPVMMVSQ